jgi:hypothetical protein
MAHWNAHYESMNPTSSIRESFSLPPSEILKNGNVHIGRARQENKVKIQKECQRRGERRSTSAARRRKLQGLFKPTERRGSPVRLCAEAGSRGEMRRAVVRCWSADGDERARETEERFKRGRPEAQLLGSDVQCSGRHAIIAAEQGSNLFF